VADVIPRTVGESLYWSYANLAMAFAAADNHDEPDYQQSDYIIRNKIYWGLVRGTMTVGSLVIDERRKLSLSECEYCGDPGEWTLDHLIPQIKGGPHAADNLVRACRPCNSSKGALDLLEWMQRQGRFPNLWLLRRYLKLAIRHCQEGGLMDVPLPSPEAVSQRSLFDAENEAALGKLTEGKAPVLPFAVRLVPYQFPKPSELWGTDG
jgi:hypothetical protein